MNVSLIYVVVVFVCLIWSFTSKNNISVMQGRVFFDWTSTKLGLMFLLKDTTQLRWWDSNPQPLGLESSPLPLSHCAPIWCCSWFSLSLYGLMWAVIFFLPAHPASFTPNFVSGMQSFYFSESQGRNCIADLSWKIVFSGVTTYVIAWMLKTRSMMPSLIYKVSFSFVKLYKLVSVKTKEWRRCLASHLDKIYNGHAQKCRWLYNRSPTNIEAGDC